MASLGCINAVQACHLTFLDILFAIYYNQK